MSCWRTTCPSPMGKLTLASDGTCLTGLWLEGQRYFDAALEANSQPREDLAVFCAARAWLDRYFAGQQPAICQLPLAPQGSAFRQTVWRLLCQIPYGEVTSYGALAKQAAEVLGRPAGCAQAVGGAVGHNPISIIIPCHRVIGADGSLTGYAGGIEKKAWLLAHERDTARPAERAGCGRFFDIR